MLHSTTVSHSNGTSQNQPRQTPTIALRQSGSTLNSSQGQSITGSFEILSVHSHNSMGQITNRLETASISSSTQGQLILNTTLLDTAINHNISHHNESDWENLSDASSSQGVHIKLDESIITSAKKVQEYTAKKQAKHKEAIETARMIQRTNEEKKNTALKAPPEMITFTATDDIDMKKIAEQSKIAKNNKIKKEINRADAIQHYKKLPNVLQHEFNNLVDNQTTLIKETANKAIKNAKISASNTVNTFELFSKKATVIACNAVISSAKKIKQDLILQTETLKINNPIKKEKTD